MPAGKTERGDVEQPVRRRDPVISVPGDRRVELPHQPRREERGKSNDRGLSLILFVPSNRGEIGVIAERVESSEHKFLYRACSKQQVFGMKAVVDAEDNLILVIGLSRRRDVVVDLGEWIARAIRQCPDTLILPQVIGNRIDHRGGNHIAREWIPYQCAGRAGLSRKRIGDDHELSRRIEGLREVAS